MFYLTTHSTHFSYGYMVSDIIIVKDHGDILRGNPLPPFNGLLFRLAERDLLYAPSTDRIAHTTALVGTIGPS